MWSGAGGQQNVSEESGGITGIGPIGKAAILILDLVLLGPAGPAAPPRCRILQPLHPRLTRPSLPDRANLPYLKQLRRIQSSKIQIGLWHHHPRWEP